MAHRSPDPGWNPRLIERVARHSDRVVLPALNLVAAAACWINQPGASPSLGFLASIVDLRVWAVVLAVSAALLVAGWVEPGYLAGMVCWLLLAAGSALALVTLSTPSPSGSLMLAALTLGAAARHVIGFGHTVTTRRSG